MSQYLLPTKPRLRHLLGELWHQGGCRAEALESIELTSNPSSSLTGFLSLWKGINFTMSSSAK